MDIKLPKLGEGADSGVVVNIFVKEGDQITKDQAIIELENEKAVASVPSTAGGKVTRIYVKAGDKLSIGQKILSLDDGGAAPGPAASKPKPKAAATEADDEPEAEETESSDSGDTSTIAAVASPSVRQIARDLGIDLSRVRGSERGGRIGRGDLRNYVQRLQKLAEKSKASGKGGSAAAESVDFSKWGSITLKPLTSLRKVIARRMSENWNTVPHVTQFADADFSAIDELRKKHAPAYEKAGGRLTVTPLILKALVKTLKQHPLFNSSLDEVAEQIVLKEYYHVGIAVDTDQGLIVPVLRDVDKKSVLDISKELEQVAKRARERKVTSEDLQGGTFTISNQGAIGGSYFTPIVNMPEVAILGLGRGALKPVAREGKVEIRMVVPLAVSYDHRVIDGGLAARFIVDLVKALEQVSEADVKL